MINALYLVAAAGMAAATSILTKLAAKDKICIMRFNAQRSASALLLFIAFTVSGFTFYYKTFYFGVAYGALLSISMLCGFIALKNGPAPLTGMVVSMSMLLPFFYGVLFLNESLSVYKAAGTLGIIFSLMLVFSKKGGGAITKKWVLFTFFTLTANGLCQIIQKMHQLSSNGMHKKEFMIFALSAAFIIFLCFYIVKRPKTLNYYRRTSLFAISSGLFNASANYLTLFLASRMSASVLFPVTSAGSVFIVFIISPLFFTENYKKIQYLGFLCGLVSIVFLNL